MNTTMDYRYTASGLDNVMLVDLPVYMDDAGEQCITITNVNMLHKVIAMGIVSRTTGISGRELRFLRTEMGLTQAELANKVKRDVQTVGRWERGECPIEANAETLIRLIAIDRLDLDLKASPEEVSGWCVANASPQPLKIDAHNPENYRVLQAA